MFKKFRQSPYTKAALLAAENVCVGKILLEERTHLRQKTVHLQNTKGICNKHCIININSYAGKVTANGKIISEHSLKRRMIQRVGRSIHHLFRLLNKEEINQSYNRQAEGFT